MREKVWIHCVEIVEKQLKALQDMMVDLNASAQNESKSSAGDKHETARAMVQIEQEQLQRQINIAQAQMSQLHAIRGLEKSNHVQPGSLVQTDQGLYFISTGIGKINIEEKEILCVSPNAPLASIFIGKKEDEVVFFNRKAIRILAIA